MCDARSNARTYFISSFFRHKLISSQVVICLLCVVANRKRRECGLLHSLFDWTPFDSKEVKRMEGPMKITGSLGGCMGRESCFMTIVSDRRQTDPEEDLSLSLSLSPSLSLSFLDPAGNKRYVSDVRARQMGPPKRPPVCVFFVRRDVTRPFIPRKCSLSQSVSHCALIALT